MCTCSDGVEDAAREVHCRHLLETSQDDAHVEVVADVEVRIGELLNRSE